MKNQAFTLTIGLVLALLPLCESASFLTKHDKVTHEDKAMPVTKHDKVADGGYKKGSPLFKKQEARKVNGVTPAPPKPKEADVEGLGEIKDPSKMTYEDLHSWDRNKNPFFLSWLGFWYFLDVVIWCVFIGVVFDKCMPGTWKRTDNGHGVWDENGVVKGERDNTPPEFAYTLFSTEHCWGKSTHHAHICFCAICCPMLRLADTWSKKPFPVSGMSFWGALVLIAILSGLSPFTAGLTGTIFLCLCVFFRQKMRKAYGLTAGGSTWCTDCCVWSCCGFCAMAQEARQVEFVAKPGQVSKWDSSR